MNVYIVQRIRFCPICMYDDNYAPIPLKCSEPPSRRPLLCDQKFELWWKAARFMYENFSWSHSRIWLCSKYYPGFPWKIILLFPTAVKFLSLWSRCSGCRKIVFSADLNRWKFHPLNEKPYLWLQQMNAFTLSTWG